MEHAFCEVKFADVYTLQTNERQIVYKGCVGKESYDLNRKLQERTEDAINQLNSRIALLRQRAEQISEKLKQANPDHDQLTRYVDEGIAKSLGKAPETGKWPAGKKAWIKLLGAHEKTSGIFPVCSKLSLMVVL